MLLNQPDFVDLILSVLVLVFATRGADLSFQKKRIHIRLELF